MFSRSHPQSSLKMIDLGLSEHYSGGLSEEHEHKSSTPIGTIAYMSPEMLQGHEYDRQCDIWSLGGQGEWRAVGIMFMSAILQEYDPTGSWTRWFTHECDPTGSWTRPSSRAAIYP